MMSVQTAKVQRLLITLYILHLIQYRQPSLDGHFGKNI